MICRWCCHHINLGLELKYQCSDVVGHLVHAMVSNREVTSSKRPIKVYTKKVGGDDLVHLASSGGSVLRAVSWSGKIFLPACHKHMFPIAACLPVCHKTTFFQNINFIYMLCVDQAFCESLYLLLYNSNF